MANTLGDPLPSRTCYAHLMLMGICGRSGENSPAYDVSTALSAAPLGSGLAAPVASRGERPWQGVLRPGRRTS